MGVLTGILIGLGVLLACICSRPLTILIHELGHAIPSLLFTDKEVIVIVGSLEDTKKSLFLNFGRLKIYLKWDVWSWYAGVCSHAHTEKFYQSFLITLGGPLFSLGIAVGILTWIKYNDPTDGLISLLTLFIISAAWDFCVNIFPSREPIVLADGSTIYNDGYTLLQLMRSQKLSTDYHQGVVARRDGKGSEAIELIQKSLDQKPSRIAATELIQVQLAEGENQAAFDTFNKYLKPLKRKTSDYYLLAQVYQKIRKPYEAIVCLNKYLHDRFKDNAALNLRGEAYLDLDKFIEAFQDLQVAYAADRKNHRVANNLGYALARMKDLEGAAVHIVPSLEHLQENARAQFQAGFYFKEKGENQKAFACFTKAKTLGFEHHGLDYFMAITGEE